MFTEWKKDAQPWLLTSFLYIFISFHVAVLLVGYLCPEFKEINILLLCSSPKNSTIQLMLWDIHLVVNFYYVLFKKISLGFIYQVSSHILLIFSCGSFWIWAFFSISLVIIVVHSFITSFLDYVNYFLVVLFVSNTSILQLTHHTTSRRVFLR